MLKIEKLPEDVQEKVVNLKTQGFSFTGIADKLNNDYELELDRQDIVAYFNKREDKFIKVLKDDKKLQEKLAKQYFDTIAKLNDLNEEMWQTFYDLRKNPEFKSKNITCPHCHKHFSVQIETIANMIKVASHLLEQIKHVDTVLGKMQKKSLNITYNVVDLTKKLQTIMPEIYESDEKRGYIKIKKKRKLKERKS